MDWVAIGTLAAIVAAVAAAIQAWAAWKNHQRADIDTLENFGGIVPRHRRSSQVLLRIAPLSRFGIPD